MDVNEVYRLLTKGLNLPKNYGDFRHVYKDNKKVLKTKIEHPLIKKDDDDEADLEGGKEDPIKEDKSGPENAITLLEGINKDYKKGKKRKLLDPNEIERKKRLLEQEEINHYRNINNISVVGRRIPNPARSFDDFKVDPDIIQNLKKAGFEEPTPIQKQAVPVMLDNRQVLACAPTGSGKTAAFLVPIIEQLKGPKRQGFRALILCPTRELASQTHRECVKLSEGRGFRIHVIWKIKRALNQYGPKSNQKFDILITTPNRLCFLLKQEPPAMKLSNIEWLIIDEADKLFEEGTRSFKDQLDQILEASKNSNRKIAMFSATTTPSVAKWCIHNMPGLVRVTVGHRNAATDTVDQELLFVGNEYNNGKMIALRNLVREGISPPVLIFVQSKERAKKLFTELLYDNLWVAAIHSDLTQTQRDKLVTAFREGKIWILICTELMARGIDFKGINLVINYDFPPSSISYVHRIGRAGRAGRQGRAITFFTEEEIDNLRSMVHVLQESGCKIPDYILKMKRKSKKSKREIAKKILSSKNNTNTDKSKAKKTKQLKDTKTKQDLKTAETEPITKLNQPQSKKSKNNTNLKVGLNKKRKINDKVKKKIKSK